MSWGRQLMPDGGSAFITEYGREVVHGGGSLLGGVPGGTRTLAPENTSILVHTTRPNTPFRRVPDSLPYS